MAWLPKTLWCQEPQTVYLLNGDRLSGRLASIKDGVWIMKLPGGDVRLQAEQVTGLSSPGLIGVRLADGTIAAVTLAREGDRIELTSSDGTRRLITARDIVAVGDAKDLAALRPLSIGLFTPITRFWSATGSFGFSDKSGNSRARGLSANVELERKSPKDRLSIGAGTTREESPTEGGGLEPTVSKYYGILRADIFISARLFTFAETRQDRDRFQGIKLRSAYTGGLGIQLVQKRNTDLRFSGSAGARIERFEIERFESDSVNTAAVAVASPALQQSFGPAKFAWRIDWSLNVADVGDFRFRSEASLTTSIYRGAGLRVSILNEYNNRPPQIELDQPPVANHDMLLTTTLTYSLGG